MLNSIFHAYQLHFERFYTKSNVFLHGVGVFCV